MSVPMVKDWSATSYQLVSRLALLVAGGVGLTAAFAGLVLLSVLLALVFAVLARNHGHACKLHQVFGVLIRGAAAEVGRARRLCRTRTSSSTGMDLCVAMPTRFCFFHCSADPRHLAAAAAETRLCRRALAAGS